ncbi:MaoC family dehydratase [Bradyrhizobium sp. 14AA]
MTASAGPDHMPDFASARPLAKGRYFESFKVGQLFRHHWGRTITAAENSFFSTLTLAFNPIYFNLDYARATGHRDLVLNPLLVFNTIFGLSVEDLSEAGGAFLGVDDLSYHRPVYVGETLYGDSTVISTRTSDRRPDFGIVSWRTRGTSSNGEVVIEFTRTNMVKAIGVAR